MTEPNELSDVQRRRLAIRDWIERAPISNDEKQALAAVCNDGDRCEVEVAVFERQILEYRSMRDGLEHQLDAARSERDRLAEALENSLACLNRSASMLAWQGANDWQHDSLVAFLERMRVDVRVAIASGAEALAKAASEAAPKKMLLFCPRCQAQHYDRGGWEAQPHHKHLCAHCGTIWDAGVLSYGVSAGELSEAAGHETGGEHG